MSKKIILLGILLFLVALGGLVLGREPTSPTTALNRDFSVHGDTLGNTVIVGSEYSMQIESDKELPLLSYTLTGGEAVGNFLEVEMNSSGRLRIVYGDTSIYHGEYIVMLDVDELGAILAPLLNYPIFNEGSVRYNSRELFPPGVGVVDSGTTFFRIQTDALRLSGGRTPASSLEEIVFRVYALGYASGFNLNDQRIQALDAVAGELYGIAQKTAKESI